jgi:hypothetical protein
MKVLSFDPGGGGKRGATGVAYQDENKTYIVKSVKDLPGFLRAWDLKKLPVDIVVVEGYKIVPGRERDMKASIGVPLTTVENIGRVKSWAELMGLRHHEYDRTLKPTICKITQVFPKKAPKMIEHAAEAWNYGRYYLYQRGLAKSALEMEMEKKGEL